MPREVDPGKHDSTWAAEHATLFASPAWYAHWFRAFGGDEFGQWRSGDAATWSFPYTIRKRRLGFLTLRVAQGAANNYTPQFDVIGNGVPTLAELRRLAKELRASLLVVPLLSARSRFVREGDFRGWFPSTEVVLTESAPLIDCTGDWDAYLKTRRKSRRAEWIDKGRKLHESGARLQVLSSWKEIEPVYEELLAVEASGWKGRKGTSISQKQNAREFFQGVCPALAEAGKLRIFLVRRDEQVIAFKLCTLHGGRLCSLKTGYRETLAKQSPGLVLQLWVTQWCFKQPGVSVFDFLGPATDHKLAWSTEIEELYTLHVYRLTFGGAVAWLRWLAAPRLAAWWRRLRDRSRQDRPSADSRPDEAPSA